MHWTSLGDRLFVVFTTSVAGRVLVVYCFVLGIAESKICVEQQIMFLCDCKCAVHLTQSSVSRYRQQEVLLCGGDYSMDAEHSAGREC